MGYLDAQQGAHARTAFRSAEKLYKRYKENSTQLRSSKSGSKAPSTDLSGVLDFYDIEVHLTGKEPTFKGVSVATMLSEKPVFRIDGHPGFYFIPRALSVEQQLYWIQESLQSFPQPPNRTNHNAAFGFIRDLWSNAQDKRFLYEVLTEDGVKRCTEGIMVEKDVCEADLHLSGRGCESPTTQSKEKTWSIDSKQWAFCNEDAIKCKNMNRSSLKPVSAEMLLLKLRWVTLGLQFDWSKKAYDVSLPYRTLPTELSELASLLAEPVMNGGEFKAEAAITNYYGPDDMLGGHVDDMEADLSNPIVSISLGCKAVYLLGGTSREEVPVAMFIRSGDVVLMAGPARQCFHGIPRIFVDPLESDLPNFDIAEEEANFPFLDYIKNHRVNINIRQVY